MQPVRATHCIVCQRPIGPLPGLAGKPVCKSFDCVRLLKQEAYLPPGLYQSMLKTQSSLIREKFQRSAAIAEQQALIEEGIKQADRALTQRLALPEGTLIVSVGTGDRPMTVLPPKRRAAFVAHLRQIAEEALANVEFKDVGECRNSLRLKHADQLHKRLPEMAGQTGRICATCRGSCCLGGSDTAFLSSTMIKAQMSALTREEADKVIHNYLSRLPPQSISESCVYHTDTGCHLPSTLRSVVCNGYLCDALEHYQNQCDAEARIRPVLVISHKYIQFRKLETDHPAEVVGHAFFPAAPPASESELDTDQKATE